MTRLMKLALAALVLLATSLPAAAQSLTTLYAGGNGQSGNSFDLRANRDLRLDRFDVHMQNVGTTQTVAVYWRNGTADGFEQNPAGWVLMGRATVVSNGIGVPTPLPVGGLNMLAGQTYGIYLQIETGGSVSYTNGAAVFSNADLSLTTLRGVALPTFAGTTFSPRQWNGTVYYSAPFTTCAAEGYTGAKLTMCRRVCEVSNTPAALASLIKLYRAMFREDPPCAD